MADINTKPKYFCENCGGEVKGKARFCPHCGRFFSAVCCPKCGHTGSATDFKNGCPNCHYAMTKEELYGEVSDSDDNTGKEIKKKKRKSLFIKGDGRKKETDGTGDVPVWLFISSIAVLLVLIFILLFYK